jgi:hypothetical protein
MSLAALRASVLLLSVLALLTACSSVRYGEGEEPEFVVVDEFTPFFTTGPGQERGPDLSLKRGERVDVMVRGMGYSFVRIADGRSGHVANEAIGPAPAPAPADEGVSTRRAASRRSQAPAVVVDEDLSDLPIDPDLPPEPVDVLHPLDETDETVDEEPSYRL